MRILFTAHQFFPEHYAGTEILTLGLVHEMKSRGHEPFVLAPRRSIPANDIRPGEIVDYEFEGIPVRRVGRPQEGAEPLYDLDYRNEVMAERAREYAAEIEPDVVHAMHFQGLSASVIPVFKEMGLPVVYTATDFWAVCPVVDLRRHDGAMCEGPELSHCARCIASRYPNSQLARAIRWTPGTTAVTAGAFLSRVSGRPISVGSLEERPGHLREKIGLVDHVIAPTRLMRDMLVSNGVGTRDTVEVSNYGIDTSHMAGGPPNTNVPPPLRIGFMGSMAHHKGCDTLIEAFRKLPPSLDASLTIHGNLERFRPFVKKLRALAGDDERIEFAGPFQREQVGRVFSETDVLVVPSRWYENAPVVIYESFAAGVPVIATNLGGMSEVVEHGENGLLFEMDDADDLARQLRRLAEEPGLLEKLRSGLPPVKTVQQSADESERIYASILARKGKTA